MLAGGSIYGQFNLPLFEAKDFGGGDDFIQFSIIRTFQLSANDFRISLFYYFEVIVSTEKRKKIKNTSIFLIYKYLIFKLHENIFKINKKY